MTSEERELELRRLEHVRAQQEMLIEAVLPVLATIDPGRAGSVLYLAILKGVGCSEHVDCQASHRLGISCAIEKLAKEDSLYADHAKRFWARRRHSG